MSENDGQNDSKNKDEGRVKEAPAEVATVDFKFENIDGTVEQLKLNDGWLIGGSGASTGSGIGSKGGIGKAQDDVASIKKPGDGTGDPGTKS